MNKDCRLFLTIPNFAPQNFFVWVVWKFFAFSFGSMFLMWILILFVLLPSCRISCFQCLRSCRYRKKYGCCLCRCCRWKIGCVWLVDFLSSLIFLISTGFLHYFLTRPHLAVRLLRSNCFHQNPFIGHFPFTFDKLRPTRSLVCSTTPIRSLGLISSRLESAVKQILQNFIATSPLQNSLEPPQVVGLQTFTHHSMRQNQSFPAHFELEPYDTPASVWQPFCEIRKY